jgi:hypothetical protein
MPGDRALGCILDPGVLQHDLSGFEFIEKLAGGECGDLFRVKALQVCEGRAGSAVAACAVWQLVLAAWLALSDVANNSSPPPTPCCAQTNPPGAEKQQRTGLAAKV